MNNRIKTLISALEIKKVDFAKRLNISQSFVSDKCSGKSKPSDRTIIDICRKFNVSEKWLRSGEGEMFAKRNRDDEIDAFINKALQDKPESFKLRLISALSRLSESDWEVLERFAADLVSKSAKAVFAPDRELTDAELHAELDRQLLEEKEREAKLQASQNSSSSDAKLA